MDHFVRWADAVKYLVRPCGGLTWKKHTLSNDGAPPGKGVFWGQHCELHTHEIADSVKDGAMCEPVESSCCGCNVQIHAHVRG